uniref:NADH dehydrogenase subunit 4L n=1 Tax=Themus foveicollis TaxID=3035637 RepID=UPI002551D63D|nr:NADH dehydrogenase subunit 4L [Themus foveicollis]WFS86430.1 NADH dehydrogenase subunit 4L [Themus foveicollis]
MFMNLFFFMGLISLIILTLNAKHLLLMLMNLEFLVIYIYFGLFLMMVHMNYEYYFSMIFLTMSVCEGTLGLSILVSMIRSYGNDYFQSFNILW